jgi:hypothetical protein
MLKNALALFSVSFLLFFMACAPKKVEVPAFAPKSLDELLSEKNGLFEIDTSFEIVLKKSDTEISGNGILNIHEKGDLSLRVYSIGLLMMELSSKNHIIKSNPRLDKNRTAILTQGLRDCFFWWDIKDFTVSDSEAGLYLLENRNRSLWIDKKTSLPIKQNIHFDDGKELTIFYDNPAEENSIRYQSRMRIELSKNTVILTIKNISFKNSSNSQVQGRQQLF